MLPLNNPETLKAVAILGAAVLLALVILLIFSVLLHRGKRRRRAHGIRSTMGIL